MIRGLAALLATAVGCGGADPPAIDAPGRLTGIEAATTRFTVEVPGDAELSAAAVDPDGVAVDVQIEPAGAGRFELAVTPSCDVAHDGGRRAVVLALAAGDARGSVVIDVADEVGLPCLVDHAVWLDGAGGCGVPPASPPAELALARGVGGTLCLSIASRDSAVAVDVEVQSTAPARLLTLDEARFTVDAAPVVRGFALADNPEIVGEFTFTYTVAGRGLEAGFARSLRVGELGDVGIDVLATPGAAVEFDAAQVSVQVYAFVDPAASCLVGARVTTPGAPQAPVDPERLALYDAFGARAEEGQTLTCAGGGVFLARYVPPIDSQAVEQVGFEVTVDDQVGRDRTVDVAVASVAEEVRCSAEDVAALACAELDGDPSLPELLVVTATQACLFRGSAGRMTPAPLPWQSDPAALVDVRAVVWDDDGDGAGAPRIFGEVAAGLIDFGVAGDLAVWQSFDASPAGARVPLAYAAPVAASPGAAATHLAYPFGDPALGMLRMVFYRPAAQPEIALDDAGESLTRVFAAAAADLDGNGATDLLLSRQGAAGAIVPQVLFLTWTAGVPALDAAHTPPDPALPSMVMSFDETSTPKVSASAWPRLPGDDGDEVVLTAMDEAFTAGTQRYRMVGAGFNPPGDAFLATPGGTPRMVVGDGGRIFSLTTTGAHEYAIDGAGEAIWTQVDPDRAHGGPVHHGYGKHAAMCAGVAAPTLAIDAGGGVIRLTGVDLTVVPGP